MPTVRFSIEFQDAFDVPERVHVDGSTVHAALDEVRREYGDAVMEPVLLHRTGGRWHLARDVEVLVNGRNARDLDGLGTPIVDGDEVVVAPLKGSAGPLGNA